MEVRMCKSWAVCAYAAFIVSFFICITALAVFSNPTSQLSFLCYGVWLTLVIASVLAVIDRRK